MGRDSSCCHLPLFIQIIPVLFYAFAQALISYACIGTAVMLCVSVPPRFQPILLLLLFLASLWFLGRSRPPNTKPKTPSDSPTLPRSAKQKMTTPTPPIPLCAMLLHSFDIRHPSIKLCASSLEEEELECPHEVPPTKGRNKGTSRENQTQQKAETAAAPFTQLDPNAIKVFCQNCTTQLLALSRLLKDMDFATNEHKTKDLMQRLNLCTVALRLSNGPKTVTYWNCPLVWDTGASFGLTPFRGDFIDYVKCSIPVKDIKSTNMVIGMGTTLHKFDIDGKPIFLPCLSYHLPAAEVRVTAKSMAIKSK